jgi:hypothetical protein
MKHLAVCLLVAACGGSSDLDRDAVTNIPPGDATGTAMTGAYRMETITTDCDGECSTNIGGAIYSACDVGTRLEDTVMVTQTDGALRIDVEDSDYVSRMEGGLDASGAYDVGGVKTQLGGQITITARTQGTITGPALTGIARLRVTGQGLSCRIETEVSGVRR